MVNVYRTATTPRPFGKPGLSLVAQAAHQRGAEPVGSQPRPATPGVAHSNHEGGSSGHHRYHDVAESAPRCSWPPGLPRDAEVVVRRTEDGVVIQEVDPDQTWYWTAEFQAGERVAEAEDRAGHGGRRARSPGR